MKRNTDFTRLLRAIASGDSAKASSLIDDSPQLALESAPVGASRGTSVPYFLEEVACYVYAGDTALHIASAAYQLSTAKKLVALGANLRARNRRGAEPLHYACTGNPASGRWNPRDQTRTIEYLIRAGADPNAADESGVGPLHRAVRTRCADAVRVLLAHGADPLGPNGSGSTPLHLAVHNTGRGGSGTVEAREQQAKIIRLLTEHEHYHSLGEDQFQR